MISAPKSEDKDGDDIEPWGNEWPVTNSAKILNIVCEYWQITTSACCHKILKLQPSLVVLLFFFF